MFHDEIVIESVRPECPMKLLANRVYRRVRTQNFRNISVFGFIKQRLQKVYNQFTSKAKELFGYAVVDENILFELEKLLISADTGVKTSRAVIANLRSRIQNGEIKEGIDLHTTYRT